MWLLFGICIIAVTTECADTNGIQNEHYLATNWERYNGNKPPDLLKLPTKILFFSPPYNSNAQQLNKILRMRSKQNKESVTKNKVIGSDEAKYQMIQLRSSGSPLAGWILAPNTNDEKERRNPLFSPWGGKRNSSPYKADPKIRRPSRVPFNSWGGKRDGESYNHDDNNNADAKQYSTVNSPGIKKPFNSWGGKRTPVVFEYFVRLSSNDLLRNIWQSTHPPLISSSTNGHIKQDSTTDNDGNTGVEENKVRIAFEPWRGRKIDVDSNEDDGYVSSAPTPRYTQ